MTWTTAILYVATAEVDGGVPMPLAPIAGAPVIAHTLSAFESAPDVDDIRIVVPSALRTVVEGIVSERGYGKVTRVLACGRTHVESTRQALDAGMRPPGATAGASQTEMVNSIHPVGSETRTAADGHQVVIHDVLRPLIDQRIIAACLRALRTSRVVTTAAACADTVLVVDGDVITAVPDRSKLRREQTPHAFEFTLLRAAHDAASAVSSAAGDPATGSRGIGEPADDMQLVQRHFPGTSVGVVGGSETNIQVTDRDTQALAEALLHARGDADAATR